MKRTRKRRRSSSDHGTARGEERTSMTVTVEKNGPVWTVIHNRPEARNAMDPESADALTQAFLAFDADDEARAAVFYGEGGAFCAGWDRTMRILAFTVGAGVALDRWWHGAPAPDRRPGPGARDHSDRSQGPRRGMSENRALRISRTEWSSASKGGRAGPGHCRVSARMCPSGSAVRNQEPRPLKNGLGRHGDFSKIY
jgi:Enoyl-CoA hydratase/isomerase